MFYIKYLVMLIVQMHAGAIRMFLYGLFVCTDDNPLAKASGLSPSTDAQPYKKTYTYRMVSSSILKSNECIIRTDAHPMP